MTNSFVIEKQRRRSGKNTLNIHYRRVCVCLCAWHYSAFSRWLVGKIKLNVQIAGNNDIALNATDLWKSLSYLLLISQIQNSYGNWNSSKHLHPCKLYWLISCRNLHILFSLAIYFCLFRDKL